MQSRLAEGVEFLQGEKESFVIGHLTFFMCHFEERLGLCEFFGYRYRHREPLLISGVSVFSVSLC
jgi:hypothetical protein